MAAAPPSLHLNPIPSVSRVRVSSIHTASLFSQSLPQTSRLIFSTRSTFHLREILEKFTANSLHPRNQAEEEEELDEEFEAEEGSEEEEEEEEEEDEGLLDYEALEEEAKAAARDYSLSLSRELGIVDGAFEKNESRRKQHQQRAPSTRIPDHLLPRVAIVGRPNVGKSAFFNRLVGGNRAIVVDEPGVTRDRLYGRSFWGDCQFMVVDTGGVMTFSKSQDDVMEELAITTTVGMDGIPLASREAAVARMPSMIERQAAAAVEEAAVIIFLVDGQAGLMAADVEISDWLRKYHSNKCVLLAVNKCESPRKGLMQASEFWSLG